MSTNPPDNPPTTEHRDYPLMSQHSDPEEYRGVWEEVLDNGGPTDNDGLIVQVDEDINSILERIEGIGHDGDTTTTVAGDLSVEGFQASSDSNIEGNLGVSGGLTVTSGGATVQGNVNASSTVKGYDAEFNDNVSADRFDSMSSFRFSFGGHTLGMYRDYTGVQGNTIAEDEIGFRLDNGSWGGSTYVGHIMHGNGSFTWYDNSTDGTNETPPPVSMHLDNTGNLELPQGDLTVQGDPTLRVVSTGSDHITLRTSDGHEIHGVVE